MADQDVIIEIGSSNMAGFAANLYDVDAGSYLRWLSEAVPTPVSPTRPYESRVPGVRMWTPRRPYSVHMKGNVTVVNPIAGPATEIFYLATDPGTPTVDQWVFILRGSGRGNLHRIIGVGAQRVDIAGSPSPAISVGDQLVVMLDSQTLVSIDSTRTILTKTGATPNFTSAVIGHYVLFLSGGAGTLSAVNEVRKIVSQTNTTITVDRPFNSAPLPGADAGFVVLTGANACEGYSSMQPPNAVLHELTFVLDETTPVYLTGLDFCTFDFTPFASPRRLSEDPTINSVAELTWQVRSKTARPLVCLQMGVSASMISSFLLKPTSLSDNLVGPLHEFTSLDFHPSSPLGIYLMLTNAITSMRTLIEAEGNTMKVRGIFINLFDNDGGDVQRVARIGANTRLLRDSLRAFIGDKTIPWIMSGPSAYGGGPGATNNTEIYRQLFAIAAADAYSGVVDTRVGYTYAEDNAHLSAASQIKLGQDFFRVWQPIHDRLVEETTALNDFSLEVCNMAVGYLGLSKRVFSLDTTLDQSKEAALCAQFYPVAFRDVQERHTWAFSTRVATLISATKDEERTDWLFSYLLPGDMDAPIEVLRPGNAPSGDGVMAWWRQPNAEFMQSPDSPSFAVERNAEGDMVIYTNVDGALLRYNAKLNSRTTVPNNFKVAVASKLAAQMVGSVVQGEAGVTLMQRLEGMARLALSEAAATDANRQQQQPVQQPQRMPWGRF